MARQPELHGIRFLCWQLAALAGVLLFQRSATAGEQALGVALLQQVNTNTFRYDIDLKDSGTTNIGTLWYSWIPGDDFLPISPTNIVSPSGWTAQITHVGAADGFAVQWVNQSGPLTPGQTLSGFGFDVQQTPAELSGSPTSTSFVYIGQPLTDAGFQFTITPTSDPWQNPFAPLDVNNDGTINAADAEAVIESLLPHGSHALTIPTLTNAPAPFVDVRGDNEDSPLDALNVINHLLLTQTASQVQPMAVGAAVSIVPEPNSEFLALLGAGLLFAALKHRKPRSHESAPQ